MCVGCWLYVVSVWHVCVVDCLVACFGLVVFALLVWFVGLLVVLVYIVCMCCLFVGVFVCLCVFV